MDSSSTHDNALIVTAPRYDTTRGQNLRQEPLGGMGKPVDRPAPGNSKACPCEVEFEHHRLDVWKVALEALVLGDQSARDLARGCGSLKDQLTRALLGAFLQTTEGAARTGDDRLCRLRVARVGHRR